MTRSKALPAKVLQARAAAFLCLCLFVAACGPDEGGDDGGLRRFSLGVIPGAQGFVDFVMTREGILEEYNLSVDKVESLNPPTLHMLITERQVDIGYAGFTTMATARTQGKDPIIVGGVFSPVNAVFVPHDSGLETLEDLRGKKLGAFGGPGSTTFAFLAVIAANWYGLDLFNDVELITAPGPALVELLARGEVDAILVGTTESIKLQAEDRFRVLADLSEEYRRHQGGRAPAHVTIATSEAYAAANPDIVRDYLRAYLATLEYIRAHPEVWDAWADSIGVDSPAARAMLREKMGPNLSGRWDEEQIAVQREYLEMVRDIIGTRVLNSIPEGLIRNEYSP